MALLQCTKATHEKENIATPIFRNISRKNILHGKGTYLQEYYLRESLKVKNYQYTVNIRRVQNSLLWYLPSVKRSSRKTQNIHQMQPAELTETDMEDVESLIGEDCVDFCSFEHKFIGERIELKHDHLKHLKLPNGVEITFGQIIALAGDFYGIPTHPIIDPVKGMSQTASDRQQRFLAAYNSLARIPKVELQNELKKLITALNKESQTRTSIGAKEWDEITGGIWLGGVPIKHGRMLKLAENNHDHFLPYAKDAYLTGHQLAMDKAREASKYGGSESRRLLHEAYSLDAFACHFLTDSFSSGHIRVPRVELGKATVLKKDGHLLSKCMHDEDGKYGLRVTNASGDKWIAYGDGMLLDEKSKDNLKFVTEAVQRSVDQVYEAYCNPTKTLETAVVTDLIPFVDKEEEDSKPMLQMKDGQLHRRQGVNDRHDCRTVTNWWGPTTAVQVLSF
ncbi:uncharacterized protein LOC144650543 isoform X2 [Oculina patagonica]